MYCTHCLDFKVTQAPLRFLCNECYHLIDSARAAEPLQKISVDQKDCQLFNLYDYHPVIRSLILQSKAHGCRQSANLLWRLLRFAIDDHFLDDVVAVCAVQSSLRSRVLLKRSLADEIAYQLTQQFGIPQLHWRTKEFFTWKKRSFMTRAHREMESSRIRIKPGICRATQNSKILVVDDVITTGYTIGSVLNEYPDFEFKALTVATAVKKV